MKSPRRHSGSEHDEDRDFGQSNLVNRRDYLRLAGAAGVASFGISSLAGRAAGNATLSRTLTIDGADTGTRYNFSVGGNLAKSRAMGASIEGNDTISGRSVDGRLYAGGRDSYAFTEEVTDFQNTGEPRFYLNGEPLTDTLTVEDIPEGRRTHYEIRVDGEVMKSPAMSATIDENDEIAPRNDPDSVDPEMTGEEALAGETYVFGGVNEWKDSYVVSGEITGFHADGNVNVYLNGELIEKPAQFVRNTLTFESTNGNRAEYDFAVSGDIAKSTWLGASINPDDTIDHGRATGYIVQGRDSYVFTGEIMEFTSTPNLRVLLNGEEVSTSALNQPPQFENTLTIDGSGGRTDYRFSVEGELAENYIEDRDSINGPVAEGFVWGGQDSYTFSGDISDFEYNTTGSFTTILNGQEVDSDTLGLTQTAPEAEDLPHEVAITGIGNDRKDYGISVERIISVDENQDTSYGDNPAGSFARGSVTYGTDKYRFSGRIESITDYETFQIDIDYNRGRIDIEDFNTGTRTDYEILFSGDLESTADTEGNDDISGGRATGAVAGGIDAYEFIGELFELTIKDTLTVKSTYKPQTDDIIVDNRDDVEHTFSIKAVDTSGSSDQIIMQEEVTVASNEQTSYATVLPVGKESRLDVSLEDGQSASRDATVVGNFPLIYGMKAQVVPEGMGILPQHVDLGPNERRVF